MSPLKQEAGWAREVAQWVQALAQYSTFQPYNSINQAWLVYACHPSIGEVEPGGSGVHGHFQLHEFEASLDYTDTVPQAKKYPRLIGSRCFKRHKMDNYQVLTY